MGCTTYKVSRIPRKYTFIFSILYLRDNRFLSFVQLNNLSPLLYGKTMPTLDCSYSSVSTLSSAHVGLFFFNLQSTLHHIINRGIGNILFGRFIYLFNKMTPSLNACAKSSWAAAWKHMVVLALWVAATTSIVVCHTQILITYHFTFQRKIIFR